MAVVKTGLKYFIGGVLWDLLFGPLVRHFIIGPAAVFSLIAAAQKLLTNSDWQSIIEFSLICTASLMVIAFMIREFRERDADSVPTDNIVEVASPQSPLKVEFEWNFFSQSEQGQGPEAGTRKTFYIHVFNASPHDIANVRVTVTRIVPSDRYADAIAYVESALNQRHPLPFHITGAYEKPITPGSRERVDVVSYSSAFPDRHIRLGSGQDGLEILHPYNARKISIEVAGSELAPRTEIFEIVVDPQDVLRMVRA